MALTLTLDYGLKVLNEPGWWHFTPSRELAEGLNPKDEESFPSWWRDDPTGTIMLKPQQLDPDFLNHAPQLTSIIRRDDLYILASDETDLKVLEESAYNTQNPYIQHTPVGPSSGFPFSPAPGPPTAFTNALTGITSTTNLNDLKITNTNDINWYLPDVGIPPAGPYTPTVVSSGLTEGKWIARTKERLPANQGLLLRWFHPPDRYSFSALYTFLVGQYAIMVRDVSVQVWQDSSAHGTRDSWKKVLTAPMFSVNRTNNQGPNRPFQMPVLAGVEHNDRGLMWLPYRRHQVLLYSSAGSWALLTVLPYPVRNADDTDWLITREDTLEVLAMTPVWGRFQIQKLKYPALSTLQLPTVAVPYTPTNPPAVSITEDSDHGTTVIATRSQPPSYTLPTRVDETCPPITDDPATGLTKIYGIEIELASSPDQRWTPFVYGSQVSVEPVLVSNPKTPVIVGDTGLSTSHIKTAQFTHGEGPGTGSLRVTVDDFYPFPLAGYYYRPSFPIRLSDGATAVFTGLTEPTATVPLKDTGVQPTKPRELEFAAKDLWQALEDTYLVDRRDWTGTGHISVVNYILQLSGYDTTLFPPEYPVITSLTNTPLGGNQLTIGQQDGQVEPGWRPRFDDTAASYIQRIADKFSGWAVGFYPDGTFYYRPKEFFTASEGTFFPYHETGTAPFMYGTPEFLTEEPEANVVQLIAGTPEGGLHASAPFIDWASIRNPNAINYLGRWRAEVFQLVGAFSCVQLNHIARRVWERTRRRYANVRFVGDYVPSLKIGHCFTLSGYGVYRLKGVEGKWENHKFHPVTYEGVLLESGF